MKPPSFDQFVTFIYVRDLHISAAFYENLLGLLLVLDQEPSQHIRREWRIRGTLSS